MSDDKDKPTVVNFKGPPDEIAAAMEGLKRNEPHMMEYHKYNARALRVKYLALVDEGFSISEALILCRDLS